MKKEVQSVPTGMCVCLLIEEEGVWEGERVIGRERGKARQGISLLDFPDNNYMNEYIVFYCHKPSRG